MDLCETYMYKIYQNGVQLMDLCETYMYTQYGRPVDRFPAETSITWLIEFWLKHSTRLIEFCLKHAHNLISGRSTHTGKLRTVQNAAAAAAATRPGDRRHGNNTSIRGIVRGISASESKARYQFIQYKAMPRRPTDQKHDNSIINFG